MIDFKTNPLFLAPMAGFTDPPFRSVVKQFGADVTISEMISSNALVYESQKSLKMLEKTPFETPYIVQIAGGDEDILKKAVLILNELDFIDGIDFNCGCPVNKVVKQCAGSALLENLELFRKLVGVIKTHNKKQFTSVKFRLGFNDKYPEKMAQICEELGVDFISIHGRTRKQLYSGSADYNSIAKAKKSVKIPVIANGDINAQNAKEVLKITACEGLMIGRASVGNPWIFYEIKEGKSVNEALKKRIILTHFEEMIKHYKAMGVSIFRKHLHEYSKGYKDASAFRDMINRIDDANLMRTKIEEFF
ncbi:tRNA-dihydrouridine synthase [Campylobacter upsaliensis]|uniref:tRNA-dihydrouridine synthase n=1 Tax=Campylobacter upsaliensis JV21 TaxID=888826 RepID=A0A828QWK9_CAMUP|nr:tRNA-dihydrouridine synthase [Campylobacter upsaliensis]EAB5281995.1 tRNA-dihydrouridine synthase [Campylobacter upsaliensis]EAH5200533.1 tRNA-dihydrouridine synthase [Campylobacter upsaliensis]EAH5218018.1 tRNA-dihydrouridine synthase [Campylobacter upsaliensis]EAH5553395.1 tRNA-dihydrouridine synthase [Campylobacter upsaliensis]EAH5848290.1 tRNA-dihydrouridine synthase [Campylobacter upsaliensis]